VADVKEQPSLAGSPNRATGDVAPPLQVGHCPSAAGDVQEDAPIRWRLENWL
jgi:hypothetical protein